MTKDKQLKMVEEDVIEMEDDMATTELTVRTSNTLEVKREQLDWSTLMEMSEVLAKSTIIPVEYRNRPENILIAVDLASRMGISPLVVMQTLYVINGKPSFSGQAIASLIRSSNTFRNVTVNYIGKEGTDTWGAYVSAERISDGAILNGAKVTIAIAKLEGWYNRAGSKWKTIPELMLAYRAYTYFGRVHLPEVMMGLHQTEELEDIRVDENAVRNPYQK